MASAPAPVVGPAAARRTGGYSTPVWFLISRRDRNRLEVLTFGAAEETLPVFAEAPAARHFLRSSGLEPGWRVREATAGELISLLLSRLADVARISLDPPAPVGETAGRESLSKREFIALLMGRPLLTPVR